MMISSHVACLNSVLSPSFCSRQWCLALSVLGADLGDLGRGFLLRQKLGVEGQLLVLFSPLSPLSSLSSHFSATTVNILNLRSSNGNGDDLGSKKQNC
jgi:hypothetical protein